MHRLKVFWLTSASYGCINTKYRVGGGRGEKVQFPFPCTFIKQIFLSTAGMEIFSFPYSTNIECVALGKRFSSRSECLIVHIANLEVLNPEQIVPFDCIWLSGIPKLVVTICCRTSTYFISVACCSYVQSSFKFNVCSGAFAFYCKFFNMPGVVCCKLGKQFWCRRPPNHKNSEWQSAHWWPP